METNKVIVTLLILTIVLSVLTVAFNALSQNKDIYIYGEPNNADTATVGLYVEGAGIQQTASESTNVGLYVEGE